MVEQEREQVQKQVAKVEQEWEERVEEVDVVEQEREQVQKQVEEVDVVELVVEVQEWVKEAKEAEEVGVAAKAVELIREWVEQYNWTVGA